MFTTFNGTGFRMDFKNGYAVSVQFGGCMHCEHQFNTELLLKGVKPGTFHQSINTEVAVLKDDEFITGSIIKELFNEGNGDEQVYDNLNADAVAKIIGHVAQIDSKKKIAETKQIETKDNP